MSKNIHLATISSKLPINQSINQSVKKIESARFSIFSLDKSTGEFDCHSTLSLFLSLSLLFSCNNSQINTAHNTAEKYCKFVAKVCKRNEMKWNWSASRGSSTHRHFFSLSIPLPPFSSTLLLSPTLTHTHTQLAAQVSRRSRRHCHRHRQRRRRRFALFRHLFWLRSHFRFGKRRSNNSWHKLRLLQYTVTAGKQTGQTDSGDSGARQEAKAKGVFHFYFSQPAALWFALQKRVRTSLSLSLLLSVCVCVPCGRG